MEISVDKDNVNKVLAEFTCLVLYELGEPIA